MKKEYIFLIILIATFFSCSKDSSLSTSGEEIETDVLFLSSTEAGSITDDTDNIENRIETIDILICDSEGKYRYYRETWTSGQQYKTTLKIENGVTLYFLANYRDTIRKWLSEGLFKEGDDWDEIIQPLLVEYTPDRLTGGNQPFPMWSIKRNVNIYKDKVNSLGTVLLLRSVASVDISVHTETDVFQLVSAQLFFAPSAGYLAPAKDNYEEDSFSVLTPSMPSATNFNTTLTYTNVTDNSILSKLFLYENDLSKKESGDRHTRLIIGGYYKKSNDLCYYPLDFLKDNELLPIIRNHKYEFFIKSVSGEGYSSAEEALQAIAVNLDYKIIEWQKYRHTDISIYGPWYLSIDTKQAYVYNRQGSFCRIPVSTNIKPEDISINFRNVPVAQNNQFSVEWITNSENEPIYLKIMALQNYKADYNHEFLDIKAGRIRTSVEIRQLTENDTEWEDGDIFRVDGDTVTIK